MGRLLLSKRKIDQKLRRQRHWFSLALRKQEKLSTARYKMFTNNVSCRLRLNLERVSVRLTTILLVITVLVPESASSAPFNKDENDVNQLGNKFNRDLMANDPCNSRWYGCKTGGTQVDKGGSYVLIIVCNGVWCLD